MGHPDCYPGSVWSDGLHSLPVWQSLEHSWPGHTHNYSHFKKYILKYKNIFIILVCWWGGEIKYLSHTRMMHSDSLVLCCNWRSANDLCEGQTPAQLPSCRFVTRDLCTSQCFCLCLSLEGLILSKAPVIHVLWKMFPATLGMCRFPQRLPHAVTLKSQCKGTWTL